MENLKRSIEYALLYIEEKAGAEKRPSGTYLRRQEIRLETKVFKRFGKQLDWLVERIRELPYFQDAKGFQRLLTKEIRNDVDSLLSELPYNPEMTEDIIATDNDVYKRGARDIHAKVGMTNYGISFDLVNPDAAQYMQDVRSLNLSNFRGSIQRETKNRIQKILVDGIEEGTSYGDMARKIRAQGKAGVFSRARAETIAVNQVANAYGAGTDKMVRRFNAKTSSFTQKLWQTVKDDRVTAECKANEGQGWIAMDDIFLSGDLHAPRQKNIRCRCTTSYRVVDITGEPI